MPRVARHLANPFVHLIAVTAVSAMLFAACGPDSNDSTTAAISAPGAAAFAANCASCHGSALQGTQIGPSLLSELYKADHHPDQSIRNAVTDGVQAHHWNFGVMPPLVLDDETITDIIAYIRATQTTEGFQAYPPAP